MYSGAAGVVAFLIVVWTPYSLPSEPLGQEKRALSDARPSLSGGARSNDITAL